MKRYVLSRCVKWLGIFLLAGGVMIALAAGGVIAFKKIKERR